MVFSAEPGECWKELASLARTVHVQDRDVLFRKGDPGRQMYAIVTGGIKISTISEAGREIVFGILGPGEILGELSLLDGQPRSATAVAIGDAELLCVERRDFLAHLERNPGLAIRLVQSMAMRLRNSDELIEDRSFLKLPARLAKWLLQLARSHGTTIPSGRMIGIKLTQQEIANLVGATRESVNKLLRHWMDAQLIDQTVGYLIIRDEKTLEEITAL
jgi:CRP-like cAMP-binding protein